MNSDAPEIGESEAELVDPVLAAEATINDPAYASETVMEQLNHDAHRL